jgi:hypothetical protein
MHAWFDQLHTGTKHMPDGKNALRIYQIKS